MFDADGGRGAPQWSFSGEPKWRRVGIDPKQTWHQFLELAQIEPMGEATLAWHGESDPLSLRTMGNPLELAGCLIALGVAGWGLVAVIGASMFWIGRLALSFIVGWRKAGVAATAAPAPLHGATAWGARCATAYQWALRAASLALVLAVPLALGIFAMWLVDGPIPRPVEPRVYAARVGSCAYPSRSDLNAARTRLMSCRKEADGSTYVVADGEWGQPTKLFELENEASSTVTLLKGNQQVQVAVGELEWRPVGPIKWSLRALAEAYGIEPLTEESRARELWRVRFDMPGGMGVVDALFLWVACVFSSAALLGACVMAGAAAYAVWTVVMATGGWLGSSVRAASEKALASDSVGSFLSRAESRELDKTVGGAVARKESPRL